MRQVTFFQYLPKRYTDNSIEVQQVRNLLYAFKDGKDNASRYTAQLVSDLLVRWYGDKANEYIVVCAPASNNMKYVKRFRLFSELISERTSANNAINHVHVLGSKTPIHLTANHTLCDGDKYNVIVDADFFCGKKVIIFDDLRTTGATAEQFAKQLEEAGATVLGGLFLAQTILVNDNNKQMYN